MDKLILGCVLHFISFAKLPQRKVCDRQGYFSAHILQCGTEMPKKKSVVNKIIILIGALYYFPRAAITKYHNLVAKNQKVIVC